MMRTLLFLLFLCLSVFSGSKLKAQNKSEELQRMADRHYLMTPFKMSEDGRRVVFRKWHDRNHDTLVLVDRRYPEKIMAQKVTVGNYFFPDNNHLLTRNRQSAELWNLEKQSGVYYKDVKNMNILKSKGLFVLHYGEEVDNMVGVYDVSGRLLQSVDHATRFNVSDDGQLYVVTKEDDEMYHLFRLSDESKETLYRSPREIKFLDIYPAQQTLMVHEQNPDTTTMCTVCIDLATTKNYPLQKVLPINPQRVFTETIGESDIFFLKVVLDYERPDSSIVDIWYGNDYQLEKKFYPHPVYAFYLWNPKTGHIEQIGKDRCDEKANLGDERFFVSVDRFLLQDYISASPKLKIDIYDRKTNSYTIMDTVTANASTMLYPSTDGEYITYVRDIDWYNYHVATGTKKIIEGKGLCDPYFLTEEDKIYFDGDGALWSYDLAESRLKKLVAFEGCEVSILNGISKNIAYRFDQKMISSKNPVLLKVYNRNENKSSYVLHKDGENEIIIPFTSMRITELKHADDFSYFYYYEENYNLPPRLMYKELGKDPVIVFQSNKTDTSILSLKQEIISYSNGDGIPLKGILYYPLNYNPSEKYPMVMKIYQIQNHLQNKYHITKFSAPNSEGFSLRALLEKGYFVYLPDIIYGENGTGLSALDCIHRSLDALKDYKCIDKNRIGLFGFSHGGYETNFIATHSNRFAAYISGAGNSDIVRSYFSYNYNFLRPFYWQFETGQYDMKKSFSEDKQLYFQNNPIHYVDQVNAPILLWTGKKDQNIYWEQTMEFYIGMKRNKKKVVALFYPTEGHAFFPQKACNDLSLKVLDWFDYYLQGKNGAKWIEEMH